MHTRQFVTTPGWRVSTKPWCITGGSTDGLQAIAHCFECKAVRSGHHAGRSTAAESRSEGE